MNIAILFACLMTCVIDGFAAQPRASIAASAGMPAAAQPAPQPLDTAPAPIPEPTDKAMRYYRSGMVLWGVAMIWGIVAPLGLLFTGLSARLRDIARRLGRNWFFTTVIGLALFAAVFWLLDLPLTFYSEYAREHAYGLSNQAFGKWLGDALKSLLVGTIVTALFMWVPYLLLRKSPCWWWLVAGLLAVPFIVLMLLVKPVWIDPLYNKFGPMKDKTLEAGILALAGRAGIEGGRVYEVNKSVDTKALSAYVTGFMNTKRIVLWDTIIARLDSRELLFVMGHEMGHYVLGHIWKTVGVVSLLALLTFYAIDRAARRVIARFGLVFGFDQMSDVASVPLLVLFFALSSFALAPPLMAYSRYQERQADRFGLELTRDNRAAATAFVKLQQENLGNPRPGIIYRVWRASHPPLGERIDFCNTYKPWRTGQPLEFQGYFRDAPQSRQPMKP